MRARAIAFSVIAAFWFGSCSPIPVLAYDPKARQVVTSTTNFNNNLSAADDNVQDALDTLDNLAVGSSQSVVTTTTAYNVTTANDVVIGNTQGGAFSITLPTAVGSTKPYTIKRIGTGNNNLTIATTSSQTIDGSTTIDLIVTNTSVTLTSDGSNWRII